MNSSSLVSRLENINEPPDAMQKRLLATECSLLNARISLLDQKMEHIQTKQLSLRAAAQKHAVPLSALHRLPSEILLETFAYFLLTDRMSINYVSHTCQLWRRLVFGAYWFWTDLMLVGREGTTIESVRAKLAHYVARTSGRPISLTIGEAPPAMPDLFLKCVFSNVVAPWSSISFIPKDFDAIHTFLGYYQKYPTQIKHLTEVSLTFEDEDENDPIFDFTPLVSLRALTLNIEDLEIPLLKVDWNSLVSLTLGVSAWPGEYLDVISQCHHLETLSITPEEEHEDDDVFESVVQLEKLQKLVITSPTPPVSLFRGLSTPFLKELILNISTPLDEEDDSLETFLNRISGNLRVLHCPGWLFVHAINITPLAKLETLRLLADYLDSDDEDQDFPNIFEFFTPKINPTNNQLSHLEVLEVLDHPPLMAHDAHLIVKMLQWRCQPLHGGPNLKVYDGDGRPRPLRRVVITENFEGYDQDFSVMDELLRVEENGVLLGSL